MTIEDGYGIQRAWVAKKIAGGRRLIGHKIGLTSRAMQRSSSIDEPDYGALLDDMLFANNSDIPSARFIEPRVEVELAFVLKHRLAGPDCTVADVFAATDYVVPAVEIIDARIRRVDPEDRRDPQGFRYHFGQCGECRPEVLGDNRIRPEAIDLRWVAALIHRNDVIEDSGVAAAVLGHPALGVAWLANKLAPWGEALMPGEIILSGSFTAPVFAAAGDRFLVDYGLLGAISARFT